MATANPGEAIDVQHEDIGKAVSNVLAALGSLKITVALFAASLVIVLVGTLAQDEMNMFDVKQRYFTSWIAWLHIDDLFPQAFFPHDKPIRGVIPFTGGALIGLMLMINLVAAKATRFRIKATGVKRAVGILTMLAGLVVGGLIIASGNSTDGLQGSPPEWLGYGGIWRGVQVALFFGVVAGAVGVFAKHQLVKISLAVLGLVCASVLYQSIFNGFEISEPGLRIVWQLTKGLGVGGILMVGCILLFGKQGGNMLLHMGVALLMLGQFIFGDRQLEQRLSLVEGQSSNALVNLDKVELSFIKSGEEEDTVTAVPGSRLMVAHRDETKISDPELPVDIKVLAFYENSGMAKTDQDNLATKGIGTDVQAVEKRKSGGVDSEINIASAYVDLIDKESGDSLGVHLVSQRISDLQLLLPGETAEDRFDTVKLGESEYKLGLRYHREVKPYWVQLEDVRRTNYSGTQTPRDYSSFIRIVNPDTGEDRRERVWMNNPLRYQGETFFQSSYTALPDGKELTGLQVVQNSGWLIPYVACSITALGMLLHFLMTLDRFLNRRARETAKMGVPTMDPKYLGVVLAVIGLYGIVAIGGLQPWRIFSYGIPTVVADADETVNKVEVNEEETGDQAEDKEKPTDDEKSVGTKKGESLDKSSSREEFDFDNFGAIPVQFGGRVMPLDTYARQALKAMCNRESLSMNDAPPAFEERVGEEAKKMSALQFLLEVATDDPNIRSLRMFRIDSEEVRAELDVPRRKSKLYSLREIGENWERVAKLVSSAADKENADRSFKEKKLIELDLRTRNYTLAAASFQLPTIENVPASFFPEGWTEDQRQRFLFEQLERKLNALEEMQAPCVIPPAKEVAADAVDDPKWTAFGLAFFQNIKQEFAGDDSNPRPGIESFGNMLEAYEKNDSEAFNAAVNEHLAAVQAYSIPGYKPHLVSMERWTKSKWPTGMAMILYICMLVLGLVCLLMNAPPLRTAVWGMLIVTFLVHTGAIVCRIFITGRAPVINIYSSAVFIGWAAVGFGLVVESIYRRGIGNVLAASAGMLTLLVAYGLNSGDTMPVLQAVLDTQFWLTTHVISVSLGYVATLVAGCFGIGFLIANWIGTDKKTQQDIYRCCYGTACFGILFSFVGTLLGGLWADDSWGRFWGWDPKENGALLIVIWNALMLHARWDGMVKARGFSILAIGGNIVTAWSWFGTNELGIGLHSYGFTSGVLMWLSIFIASQLAFIFLGMMIYRRPPDTPSLG